MKGSFTLNITIFGEKNIGKSKLIKEKAKQISLNVASLNEKLSNKIKK